MSAGAGDLSARRRARLAARLDDMSALPHFDWWLAARFDALMLTPQVAVQQIRQPDVITSVRFAQRCQQGR